MPPGWPSSDLHQVQGSSAATHFMMIDSGQAGIVGLHPFGCQDDAEAGCAVLLSEVAMRIAA